MYHCKCPGYWHAKLSLRQERDMSTPVNIRAELNEHSWKSNVSISLYLIFLTCYRRLSLFHCPCSVCWDVSTFHHHTRLVTKSSEAASEVLRRQSDPVRKQFQSFRHGKYADQPYYLIEIGHLHSALLTVPACLRSPYNTTSSYTLWYFNYLNSPAARPSRAIVPVLYNRSLNRVWTV